MQKKLIIFLSLLGILGIVGGFVVVWVKITRLEEEVAMWQPITEAAPVTVVKEATVSGITAEQVDQKIALAIKNLPASTQTTITKTVTAPAQSQPKEFVIPLGSGTITDNDKWVDIYSAQATINTDNYPNIKAAYFEAVMHIPNGQGEIKAKLAETTMPFYYGDIIKTTSGTGELVSTPMILQTGNRNYRVQLNNQIGTGVLDSARIRIVTQ